MQRSIAIVILSVCLSVCHMVWQTDRRNYYGSWALHSIS